MQLNTEPLTMSHSALWVPLVGNHRIQVCRCTYRMICPACVHVRKKSNVNETMFTWLLSTKCETKPVVYASLGLLSILRCFTFCSSLYTRWATTKRERLERKKKCSALLSCVLQCSGFFVFFVFVSSAFALFLCMPSSSALSSFVMFPT